MNPWTLLDLDRTEDVSEIRRAYARRLKSIDADADPQAFIELREALGQAMYHAQRQAQPMQALEPALEGAGSEEAGVENERPDSGLEGPSTGRGADPRRSDDSDVAEAVPVEGPHARFQRLESLLLADTDAAPDPDGLVAAVLAILDHPDMIHLDHEASVQRWLADQLAKSIPRCDPVIPLVVDRFGWEKHAGQLAQPWAFDVLVDRRHELATPKREIETRSNLDNWVRVEAASAEGDGAGDPDLRMPVAAPGDESKPDPAFFARIEALLFGPSGGDVAGELSRLTQALLSHPSMLRIQVADMVEGWLIDRIANASPRSDPMLTIAAAHFGWQDRLDDWRTPPVVQWLVQREYDAEFERRLVEQLPEFVEVLDALRGPEDPPDAKTAWRLLPNVRAFMEFATANLPTSMALCNPAAVEWWNDHIRQMPMWQREMDALRRMFRGHRSIEDRLNPIERKVDVGLFIGILVIPFIFGWAVLRRGHSKLARAGTFAWMGIMVLIFASMPEPPPRKAAPSPFVVAEPYQDPAEDFRPVLLAFGGRPFTLETIHDQNPLLHDQLMARWREAKAARENSREFRDGVEDRLYHALGEAVRSGDYELQAAYWQLTADRMRWIRARFGPSECGKIFAGDRPMPELPEEYYQRYRQIFVRALIEPSRPRHFRSRNETGHYRIPSEMFDAGRVRSGMEEGEFEAGLGSSGTPRQRCHARIGLIDAALSAPRARSAPFIRDMSGGL